MPSNRWPKRLTRALRDFATHAQMRADLLPRLPFVIALVVAVVALVAAIEHDPGADARVASVEEQPSLTADGYTDEEAYEGEVVLLDIVEYGFSKITARDGEEYVLVAVVVDNPYDGELVPGGLAIQIEVEHGYRVNLDTMYLGSLPPHSTASVGYAMLVDAKKVEVEGLRLEQTEETMLYPSDIPEESAPFATDPLPTFATTAVEPLASPDGYRLYFRAETPVEAEAQIAVLFRDSDGKLLGGLPAGSDHDLYFSNAFRALPAGESEQYVDVTAEWIPEGTDLDRIEIGPSRY